jgi:hypothetical protein
MAFRFPLASVLRLREIHEQREERLLTQILAQITQTREAIADTNLEITTSAAGREKALLDSAMSAAEIQASYGMAASFTRSNWRSLRCCVRSRSRPTRPRTSAGKC